MDERKLFSLADVEQIGDALGIDWDQFGIEQFRFGIAAELDNDGRDPQFELTHDEALNTGKITLAHLREYSEYYSRVAKMEKEAYDYWADV